MFKKDYKNYVIATVATCALFFMIYLYLCRNNLTAEKDKKEQKKPESKTGEVTIIIPQENKKQLAINSPEKKEPEKKEPEKKEPEKKELEKKELAKKEMEKKGGGEKKEDLKKEDLAKKEVKKDASVAKIEKEKDSKKSSNTSGSVDLASSVKGDGKGVAFLKNKELTKNEKNKEEDKKVNLTKNSPEKNIKGVGEVQPQSLSLPNPTSAIDPTKNSPVQGKYEGVMPPIYYTGETDRFFKKYPRLECVWVYEKPQDKPGVPPAVSFEFVVDSEGRLAYQNIRNSSTFGDFTDTIYSYDSNSQVKISNPSGLKILSYTNKIAEITGIQSSIDSQMSIGLYRRKEEVAFLAPIAKAFKRMVADKKINFDLNENPRIEVNWGLDASGGIFVNYATFVPAKSKIIKIEF